MDSQTPDADVKQQARELLARGEAGQALRLLNPLLTKPGMDAETSVLAGVAFGMIGDSATGIPYLERAVSLEPDKASHHYNLASALEKSGQYAQAADRYRAALQCDPGYTRAADALKRLEQQTAPQPPSYGQPASYGQPGAYGQPPASPPYGAAPPAEPLPYGVSPPTPPYAAPYGAPSSYGTPPYGAPGYGAPGYGPPAGAPFGMPYGAPGYAYPTASQGWDAAPPGPRDARGMNIFFGFVWALLGILRLGIAFSDYGSGSLAAANRLPEGLLAGIIMLAISVFLFWLASAIKSGMQAAWTIELLLLIICLIFIPLGTVLSIIVLLKWFKPETKAWFGSF